MGCFMPQRINRFQVSEDFLCAGTNSHSQVVRGFFFVFFFW